VRRYASEEATELTEQITQLILARIFDEQLLHLTEKLEGPDVIKASSVGGCSTWPPSTDTGAARDANSSERGEGDGVGEATAHVIDTHVHADHRSGGRELVGATTPRRRSAITRRLRKQCRVVCTPTRPRVEPSLTDMLEVPALARRGLPRSCGRRPPTRSRAWPHASVRPALRSAGRAHTCACYCSCCGRIPMVTFRLGRVFLIGVSVSLTIAVSHLGLHNKRRSDRDRPVESRLV